MMTNETSMQGKSSLAALTSQDEAADVPGFPPSKQEPANYL